MSPEAFQFRFQKVLDLREQQQRALEMELGRLDRELLKARAEAARWEDERAASLSALAEARRGGDLEEDARTGRLPQARAHAHRVRPRGRRGGTARARGRAAPAGAGDAVVQDARELPGPAAA